MLARIISRLGEYGAADGGRDRRRRCPRLPFALVDRLRELDPGRLLDARADVGRHGNGPLPLTPLEWLAALAAMVPPGLHSHHYSGVRALTAASWKSGDDRERRAVAVNRPGGGRFRAV